MAWFVPSHSVDSSAKVDPSLVRKKKRYAWITKPLLTGSSQAIVTSSFILVVETVSGGSGLNAQSRVMVSESGDRL
jgi:hypothetical protein